jgi:hypothetical protein
VVKERLARARWLRTCPVCRSDAVQEVFVEPIDWSILHCLVRCGQCETWRAVFDERRAVRRLERRLRRKHRRDRRRIARDAHLNWPYGAALEIWLEGAPRIQRHSAQARAGVRRD